MYCITGKTMKARFAFIYILIGIWTNNIHGQFSATRKNYKEIKIRIFFGETSERWAKSGNCGGVAQVNSELKICTNGPETCNLVSPVYDFSDFKGNNLFFTLIGFTYNLSSSQVFINYTDSDRKHLTETTYLKENFNLELPRKVKDIQLTLIMRGCSKEGISALNASYYECQSDNKNSTVEFAPISVPIESNVKVRGRCISNSIIKNPQNPPEMTCKYDNTYTLHGEGCICEKGYYKAGNICKRCENGKFKNKTGNEECKKCAQNAISDDGINCICKENFSKTKKTDECFELLAKPVIIQIMQTHDSIKIKWRDAAPNKDGEFVIVCKNCPNFVPEKRQNSTTITINGLNQNTTYQINVWKENSVTKGADNQLKLTINIKTDIKKEKENKSIQSSDTVKSMVIVGSVVGGLVLIIIILIIIIVYKKNFPRQFDVSRMEDGTMKMERRYLFTTSRIYTDPTTYSQVDDAVQQFALELDRKHITMDHLLGGGEFANVFKGILSTDSRNTDVAIKVLKPNSAKSDRDDFLSEAAILGQFSDPNVITIEGVILKDQPNLIVLEFMSNGSLDKYLVKNDSQLSTQKLLGMTRGVASGMKYLSELGYIHRDLAARNILVNSEGVCKIADFGMSRELKTDDTYDTKGGKIPIKWTAPEAIEFKKFTTASDVWSYGILMWEIFSFGERPYWEWSNLEVMERLSTGYRLPPPMECPKVIHDLMLQCWHKDRIKRPRFSVIFEKIEDWLKKPELLMEIASVITRRDEDLDYSVMEDLESWLQAIKMEQYLKMFTESGYMTPKDVVYLTNEDLEALGVGILGHRKKLLKAIRNTRLQIEDDRTISSSSDSTISNTKVNRTGSFAGFSSTLTKKVSFLASPNGSITFKKTLGKRASLGYKQT